MKNAVPAVGLLALLALTACSASEPDAAPSASDQPTTSTPASPSAAPSAPPRSGTSDTDGETTKIVGTVVRFSSNATSVDVTIGQDNPAVRDFLSMLPLTLTFEDLAGKEKISYLSRKLNHSGSPGSDPEDGDLIYFTSWGNLGFYYNAAGIGYSDQTIHIGTYDAPLEQLQRLEGGDVTVEVID
ncbi:cyclophilin-like fold protein [Nonomuraea basaltis]|uniref:cyclophilin-like fold protein n=1 Tax=Nonomuraea basaltis TaxID=2495887 RepID=UPI0019805833|nr:cyclophilin-like fold protein [Nonomuraea basaltis]